MFNLTQARELLSRFVNLEGQSIQFRGDTHRIRRVVIAPANNNYNRFMECFLRSENMNGCLQPFTNQPLMIIMIVDFPDRSVIFTINLADYARENNIEL